MPCCCAVGCSNSRSKGFKLYYIPSGKNDQERRKMWLNRINRGGNFQPNKHTVLCGAHFEQDEFERNVPGKLKPTAVPSIFKHRPAPKHRKPPKRSDDNKLISITGGPTGGSDCVLDEHCYPHVKQLPPAELHKNVHEAVDPKLNKNVNEAVDAELDRNVAEVVDLKEIPFTTAELEASESRPMVQPSIEDLLETVKILKNNLQRKNKELHREKTEKHFLQKKMGNLFNSDQLKFLENSEKKSSVNYWTDETIEKAVKIHFACGSTGYCHLLAEGFPLPSERTLRRRLQRITFDDDIISEVMQMLEEKVNSMTDDICLKTVKTQKKQSVVGLSYSRRLQL